MNEPYIPADQTGAPLNEAQLNEVASIAKEASDTSWDKSTHKKAFMNLQKLSGFLLRNILPDIRFLRGKVAELEKDLQPPEDATLLSQEQIKKMNDAALEVSRTDYDDTSRNPREIYITTNKLARFIWDQLIPDIKARRLRNNQLENEVKALKKELKAKNEQIAEMNAETHRNFDQDRKMFDRLEALMLEKMGLKTLKSMGLGNSVLSEPYASNPLPKERLAEIIEAFEAADDISVDIEDAKTMIAEHARIVDFIERLHYELKLNGYSFWARKCELILGRSLQASYDKHAAESGEEPA